MKRKQFLKTGMLAAAAMGVRSVSDVLYSQP